MNFSLTFTDFLKRNKEVARVKLTRVQGSSPRNVGTEMFVTIDETFGTIGGGQLEYMMIDEARALLARGHERAIKDVPLGPEIGQCCGGRVEIEIRRMNQNGREHALRNAKEEAEALPLVYIMGAGHVGRALAGFFAQLPVHAILSDTRADELSLCTADVELCNSAIPEAEIVTAPPGSAFIVLTHDHALDFLLASQALRRGDAAYVGMIGSATKRTRFRSWCRDHCDGQTIEALICPIGAGRSADKRPEIIAAFVVAEVMAALTGDNQNVSPAAMALREAK